MVALPDSAPDEVRRRLLGESFRLTPTNAAPLRLIDGVLFSADGKTLLAYPRGKTGEYVVPDGVEKIAERAFYECKALQAITLPDGLQTIAQEAFYKCCSLERIIFGDGLKTIESQAFYKCRSLEKIIFGDGLKTIESQAFYKCKSLRAVIFPDGLQTIDASAFDQCNNLWSFALSDGIRFYNLAGLLRRLSETRSIASPDSAPDDASSPRRDESLRPQPTRLRVCASTAFSSAPTEKRSSLVRATKPANTSFRKASNILPITRFTNAKRC
ncbi:MAG: leucine-rich repeat domain-containing protein [Thermoguttaceae bacterium]|nr:leucine-rich repeat domain-containing protein [Thermoguttaceae bacterium]